MENYKKISQQFFFDFYQTEKPMKRKQEENFDKSTNSMCSGNQWLNNRTQWKLSHTQTSSSSSPLHMKWWYLLMAVKFSAAFPQFSSCWSISCISVNCLKKSKVVSFALCSSWNVISALFSNRFLSLAGAIFSSSDLPDFCVSDWFCTTINEC